MLPARPGVDYSLVADTAYYTAAGFASDMAGDDFVLADLAEQEHAAREWFASHDASDPQWQRANERRIEIEQTQTAVQITRHFHARGCWASCCDVFASMSHLLPLERQSWLLDHAPGMVTDSPFSVWRHFMQAEPAPGSWPPVDSEAYLEGRMKHVPVWEKDELKAIAEAKGVLI